MKKFKELREGYLEEKLKASDPAGTYIHDFVHSDNPKFAGKSKAKRIQMALAASYAAKGKSRNEEVEGLDEDRYDDMLDAMLKKGGKRLLAKDAKEVQRHKDINSGKALKQHIKKNPGVLKTHSDAVKKDKTMYGEDFESVEEGMMDTVKTVAKKIGKALTGGSDQDQLKNLQKKMGVPQTGKKPTSK
jgi:uncharacterized membrane-anchored protein YjiN (DUF445 family)